MAREQNRTRKARKVQQPLPVERNPNASRALIDSKATASIRRHISVAGVFEIARQRRGKGKKKRSREKTPEFDLVSDFQGGLDKAHMASHLNLKTSFESVRARFHDDIAFIRSDDHAFLHSTSVTAGRLAVTLSDEIIEIESIQKGERFKETVNIGKRAFDFKDVIERESAKLDNLWKQWDDVQSEYIELGVDVFGARAFGQETQSKSKQMEDGFRYMLSQLENGHNSQIAKLTADISTMRTRMAQRMLTSENELIAASKAEQTKLLQKLIEA